LQKQPARTGETAPACPAATPILVHLCIGRRAQSDNEGQHQTRDDEQSSGNREIQRNHGVLLRVFCLGNALAEG
jgi:hypothetical protein